MQVSICDFNSVLELIITLYVFLGVSNSLSEQFKIQNWIKKVLKVNDHVNIVFMDYYDEKNKFVQNSEKVTNSKFVKWLLSFFNSWNSKSKEYKCAKCLHIFFCYECILIGDENYNELENKELKNKLIGLKGSYVSYMNHIYLYFGLMTFIVLFLSSLINYTGKHEVLQIINILSLCVIIYMFRIHYLLFYKERKPKNIISRSDVFWLSLIFFLYMLCYLISGRYFVPIYISNFNLGKLNIIGINSILYLLLALMPVIMHAFFLSSMIIHHKEADDIMPVIFPQGDNALTSMLQRLD